MNDDIRDEFVDPVPWGKVYIQAPSWCVGHTAKGHRCRHKATGRVNGRPYCATHWPGGPSDAANQKMISQSRQELADLKAGREE
jgi:hypothetical protein